MAERLTEVEEEIIASWKEAKQFEEEDYDSLSLDLQFATLEQVVKLDKKSRERIVNILFPKNK